MTVISNKSNGNRNNNKVSNVLRMLISGLLLFVLVKVIDKNAIMDVFIYLDPGFFIFSLLIFLISTGIFWALRWHQILKAAGVSVSLWSLVQYNFVGGLFSLFLPTAIGGDIARLFDLSQGTKNFSDALSSVFLDRIIGLISLVFLALLAVVFGSRFIGETAILISISMLILALLIIWIILFNSSVSAMIIRMFHYPVLKRGLSGILQLYNSLNSIKQNPRYLLSSIVISLFAQVLEIVSVILIALSVGVDIPLVYYFIFLPVIWVITLIPISIGGLGIREGAFVFLFSQVGVASSEAVAMSILVFVCRIVMGLFGGLIFVRKTNNYYLRFLSLFGKSS